MFLARDYTNLKGVCKGKFLYNDGTAQWDTEVKVTEVDIKDLLDYATEQESDNHTSYPIVRVICDKLISEFQKLPVPKEPDPDRPSPSICDVIEYEVAMENWRRECDRAYGTTDVLAEITKNIGYWGKIKRMCVNALEEYK